MRILYVLLVLFLACPLCFSQERPFSLSEDFSSEFSPGWTIKESPKSLRNEYRFGIDPMMRHGSRQGRVLLLRMPAGHERATPITVGLSPEQFLERTGLPGSKKLGFEFKVFMPVRRDFADFTQELFEVRALQGRSKKFYLRLQLSNNNNLLTLIYYSRPEEGMSHVSKIEDFRYSKNPQLGLPVNTWVNFHVAVRLNSSAGGEDSIVVTVNKRKAFNVRGRVCNGDWPMNHVTFGGAYKNGLDDKRKPKKLKNGTHFYMDDLRVFSLPREDNENG